MPWRPPRVRSRFMYTLAKGIAAFLLRLATCFCIALTLFVALSAVMRYVVGAPFSFTEEMVGLFFSALVLLALPYVTLHWQHIEVRILTDRLPPALRRWPDRQIGRASDRESVSHDELI